MSAQQRIDPLSRLIGISAPRRLASLAALDSGAPAADESGGAPSAAPDSTPARVAERSAPGAGLQGEPAGDPVSRMRNEEPGAPAEESHAPATSRNGRGRRADGAGPAPTTTTSAATTGVSAAITASSGPDAGTAAGATTAATGTTTNPLEALAPAIDQARTFAERWEIPYRGEIFRVALGQLLGTAERSPMPGAAASVARPPGTAPVAAAGAAPRPTANVGPAEKLARQLNVDIDAVDRALQFEDGRVVILARIDGKTRRELQTKYGLVLLYVKEIALATRLVGVEELRAVCVEHSCYDQGNFIGNFKKAQQDGLMREQPAEKGARARRYMLTQKGMNEAAALLRELVLE